LNNHPKKKAIALISGSGSNLQAIIDAIKNKEINLKIETVISNIPNAKGLERAKSENIPTFCINNKDFSDRIDFDKHLLERIQKYSTNFIILAGFMRILTPDFINRYEGIIINIHPSLLPKYPGLNTHQKAINAGDKWHGCTVHIVTEELDGGPPIMQGRIPIKKCDDVKSLAARVLKVEHKIYKESLKLLISNELIYKNKKLWLNNEELKEPLDFKIK